MSPALRPPDDLRPIVSGERLLRDVDFLAFPFRVLSRGPATSGRADHVREQIEQLLFTAPGERVHRPDFGVGVEHLVFEPGGEALKSVISQRLIATVAEALAGEVDPESIRATVEPRGESTVVVRIEYALATISRRHQLEFTVGGGDG